MVSFERKKNQGYGKAMMVKLSFLIYVLGKRLNTEKVKMRNLIVFNAVLIQFFQCCVNFFPC